MVANALVFVSAGCLVSIGCLVVYFIYRGDLFHPSLRRGSVLDSVRDMARPSPLGPAGEGSSTDEDRKAHFRRRMRVFIPAEDALTHLKSWRNSRSSSFATNAFAAGKDDSTLMSSEEPPVVQNRYRKPDAEQPKRTVTKDLEDTTIEAGEEHLYSSSARPHPDMFSPISIEPGSMGPAVVFIGCVFGASVGGSAMSRAPMEVPLNNSVLKGERDDEEEQDESLDAAYGVERANAFVPKSSIIPFWRRSSRGSGGGG